MAFVAGLSACASPTASHNATPDAVPASRSKARPNDYGNIRWNKAAIHVHKSKGAKSAVLTFWAKDGYFRVPNYCQNGGNFDAVAGRTRSNPNRYDHTHFKFTALTSQPDTCTFTVILANTGSPPIATLTVYLNS
ncbi:MAG TPA: hypothetical protein VGF18_08100 [Candidatus Tumulicola sp.]|jgi:hypothetical protein